MHAGAGLIGEEMTDGSDAQTLCDVIMPSELLPFSQEALRPKYSAASGR